MTQPSPEVVERMVAFVHRMAQGLYLHGCNEVGFTSFEAVAAAKHIAADLPEPIDPALIEARRIAQAHVPFDVDFIGGGHDHNYQIKIALDAIRAGRALAEAGK